MASQRRLRLGSRSSLLALAQSRQVAERLQQCHPGLQVDLVTMLTPGDRDQRTPLRNVNDPDFFSAELDAALINGHVDFCVHSSKDLGTARSPQLVRAAVPGRAFPHDVVVFRADIADVLRTGMPLAIGCSSQRRRINVGDFLPAALPRLHGDGARIQFCDLRGPVHERLARVSAAAGQDQLDGVVLALAGLQRLWADSDGRGAIAPLLLDCRWMVLPLSEVPTAPGQGALAIECRSDDMDCRAILQPLHDDGTAACVQIEQSLVDECAGPDADNFGATATGLPELGYVAHLRGRSHSEQGQQPITLTRSGIARPCPAESARPWDNTGWKAGTRLRRLGTEIGQPTALFVAHSDALRDRHIDAHTRCWTSGTRSWRALAKQGIWIEGCADNLGFAAVKPLLEAPVLGLPALTDWTALTHADAVDSWDGSGVGNVLATYRNEMQLDSQQLRSEMQTCTHFFWSSARQYKQLRAWVPDTAQHACGAGKTYAALRAAGVSNLQPFSSRNEWQQWLA